MPYAAVINKTIKSVNMNRNDKLRAKLGRDLYPNEIIYTQHSFTTYICILRPKLADYHIRKTKLRNEAIFYLADELPYVKHILKGQKYSIIDVHTNQEVERLPAAINIALTAETVGEVSCSSQL